MFFPSFLLVCRKLNEDPDDDYNDPRDEGYNGFETWPAGKVDPARPVRIKEGSDTEE
jgi:hypothetical protein